MKFLINANSSHRDKIYEFEASTIDEAFDRIKNDSSIFNAVIDYDNSSCGLDSVPDTFIVRFIDDVKHYYNNADVEIRVYDSFNE